MVNTLNLFVLIFNCIIVVNGERCIQGMYHMDRSAPATEAYAECKTWDKDTCCTANFTIELNKNRVRNLYNFTWSHCKTISQECEKFLLAQECFYQCDPKLIEWHLGKGKLKAVPVCGDYCDAWYKACENDETCLANWFEFDVTKDVNEKCPKDSTCRTFKQMYGSGKRLCNTLWGEAFAYTDPKCPCARLDMTVPKALNKTSSCSGSVPIAIASDIFALMALSVGVKMFLF